MKYGILLEAICLNNKRMFTLHKQIVRIIVPTKRKKSMYQSLEELEDFISSL